MKIIKDANISINDKARAWTKENMQDDFNYEIAERLTYSLQDKGFISDEKARKISHLNREIFQAFYKGLLD